MTITAPARPMSGSRPRRTRWWVGTSSVALVLSAGAWVPAVADTTINAYTMGAGGNGDCAIQEFRGEAFKYSPVHAQGTAAASVSMNDVRQIHDNGRLVGRLELEGRASIRPQARNGVWHRYDMSSSGSFTFRPVGGSIACGDANGLIGQGGLTVQPGTVLPTGRRSWLQLTVKRSGSSLGDGSSVSVAVRRDGPDTDLIDAYVRTSLTTGTFLPANSEVRIAVNGGAGHFVRGPLTSPARSNWSVSASGVVHALGTAMGAQSGTVKTRRKVALPGRLSCASRVKVAVKKQAATSRTRSLRILVNGQTAKRVTTVKKRTHAVKVPRDRAVTVTVRLKTRAGDTRITQRRYAPCG